MNSVLGTLSTPKVATAIHSVDSNLATRGVSLVCRVPRSVQGQVHEFVDGVRIAPVRAGWRQVIDLLDIVLENSFRLFNGRSAVFG